jgi:hypothetical protein
MPNARTNSGNPEGDTFKEGSGEWLSRSALSRENLSIPIPFPASREEFSLDLNPTGKRGSTSDIIKEFPLIPDAQPKPHRECIPDPRLKLTVAEPGPTRLLYFLLIEPIVGPRGETRMEMLSHS